MGKILNEKMAGVKWDVVTVGYGTRRSRDEGGTAWFEGELHSLLRLEYWFSCMKGRIGEFGLLGWGQWVFRANGYYGRYFGVLSCTGPRC